VFPVIFRFLARLSICAFVISIAGVRPGFAFSPPNLSNLDSNQVDAVFKDFGTGFVFRPLEPASDYGKIMGFSFGVIGSLSSSSDIRNTIPDTSGLSYMPNAEIYLGVQAPLGLAGELGFLPSLSIGGFKVHSIGGDIKWTLNDVSQDVSRFPFSLAFRAMIASSGLSYGQTVSGVSDTISYSSLSYGTNLSISKRILFIEPYVGAGYVRTNSTLSNTGSVTLFQTSVSLTDSFSDSNSGVWLYGGVQLWLLFPAVTLEYDDIYGAGAASVKVSFKF
jgi:hypothetical protein